MIRGSWNLPEGLSAATKDTDIAGECVFSSESQERLDLLTQAEALARQGTTRAEAQRLQRLASRVERLKESLTTVTASISQHTLETLIKLRDAIRRP